MSGICVSLATIVLSQGRMKQRSPAWYQIFTSCVNATQRVNTRFVQTLLKVSIQPPSRSDLTWSHFNVEGPARIETRAWPSKIRLAWFPWHSSFGTLGDKHSLAKKELEGETVSWDQAINLISPVTYLTFGRPCKFADYKNKMYLYLKVDKKKARMPRKLHEWDTGKKSNHI